LSKIRAKKTWGEREKNLIRAHFKKKKSLGGGKEGETISKGSFWKTKKIR